MSERVELETSFGESMRTKLRLEEPGALVRPGPVGRLVRLLFGVLCLSFLWLVLQTGGDSLTMTLSRFIGLPAGAMIGLSIGAIYALRLFNYVVNIGFSRDWRRRPLGAVVILFALAGLAGWMQSGLFWGPILGGVVLAWLLYIYAHLGLSFVLAAVLSTPGCEMRAIHHLWTLVTGRPTKEHYCPLGPLHRIDQWEAGGKRR